MKFLTIPVVENETDKTGWTDWTPTISSAVGSFTTTTVNRAKYRQLGKVVEVEASITITDIGTASGDLRVSHPITGIIYSGDVGTSWLQGGIGYNEDQDIVLQCVCLSGETILWTKTNGFPAADTETINFRAFYEIP